MSKPSRPMPRMLSKRQATLALIEAVVSGDAARIPELLAAGANPHGRNSAGIPVLTLAASGGCAKSCIALLRAGADPNASDRDGRTALHEAPIP